MDNVFSVGPPDVFVLPSFDIETFSNIALEAIVMYKSTILSDVGGTREMVCDGASGDVISSIQFAQCLPRLLLQFGQDDAAGARFGHAAPRRVETQFSFDDRVDRYRRLIEDAGDGPHR